jgi:BioD-like phosphotransacetylase family protein
MTDRLRLVIDIEGVTDDQVLAAVPLRLTGTGGFSTAAEGVAMGDPSQMDRAVDVERAVDAQVLESAADALTERDAGGFDHARRDEVARYLRTAAHRIRAEVALGARRG